jgi:hypothetical protein
VASRILNLFSSILKMEAIFPFDTSGFFEVHGVATQETELLPPWSLNVFAFL